MTNPTYTDEQVLKCAKTYEGYGEPVCPAMLRSLLADRKRLQAEVEALRGGIDIGYLIGAFRIVLHALIRERVVYAEDIDTLAEILRLLEALQSRATPNETKEAS